MAFVILYSKICQRAARESKKMDVLFYERNAQRYETNIEVEVQMNFWNPFSHKTAKLLDFSLSGFKIEFLENFRIKHMENIFIFIPLNLFDINDHHKLKIKAELKWFDPLHKQAGGAFLFKNKNDEEIVQKIISTLAKNSEKAQK